ncbi:MAG: SAV_2336 N-terminal domain-related protein [Microcystaceae cyanobacterium]
MIDSLITALSQELELSAEEIADTIWLALQIDESPSLPTPIENLTPPSPTLSNETLDRETTPEIPNQTETSEDIPPNNPPEPQKAGIYPRTEQKNAFESELSFKVPDAPSLREPLSLARALKPLMRRIPSGTTFVLDEEATTQRIADEGLWLPVLKPTLEPWLDLELVVDEGISMQIWRSTIRELERLLKNYGIFRDVRVWGLTTDEFEQVQLRRGLGETVSSTSLRSPAELLDPSGRRLVLVVSDCVSPLWRGEKLTETLDLWAKKGLLAILQMLPQWLWKRTALGRASEVGLQGLNAGEFNQNLRVKTVSLWQDEEISGVNVPVFTLETDRVGSWAQMVSGMGSIWIRGYVFKKEGVSVSLQGERFGLNFRQGNAESRVQAFRVTASPMARKLAGLLAASPVISLPIVRLIQETMLRESQQVHVAEVFLGGLLKPLSEINAETNPNYVLYEFRDGVRDLLVDSVPSESVLNVVDEVSKYVAKKVGLSLAEFGAVLRGLQRVEDSNVGEEIGYFATVTAQVLRRLGGKYVRLAEELEGNNRQDNQENVQEDLEVFPNIEYTAGGFLSRTNPSYIKRKADEELYNALKKGQFCIINSPRQMGKSSLILRVSNHLQEEGFICEIVDLSVLGNQKITLEQWYSAFTYTFVHRLQIMSPSEFRQWWEEHTFLPPVQRLGEFLNTIILKSLAEKIVIFIDELDIIYYLEFDTSDFFSLLRSLHERKNDDDNNDYNRLTFVLSGVFLGSDLISAINRSPFNVGVRINLEGFTYEEALPLSGGLAEKTNNPQQLLKGILEWTGGQPVLTQKICDLVKQSETNIPEGQEKAWLENLVRTQIIEHWEVKDQPLHFSTIRSTILDVDYQQIKRLSVYKSILQGEQKIKDSSKTIQNLIRTGLVVRKNGTLKVANKIYTEVFNQEWIENNLANSANSARFALIIAIPEYDHFSRLSKTTQDAETIAQLLHNHGGYQITRLPYKGNAETKDYEMKAGKVTVDKLYKTIRDFLEVVKGRPSLIYFTGHGFTVCDRLQRTTGYLATSDCRVTFKDNQIIKQENGFPLEGLDYLIKEANLSELVVLLDCCHSGNYIESSLMRRSLRTFEHKQNYYLITACRSSETAKTIRKDEHSVFSGAIIKGLSDNNVNAKGEISYDRLFDSVNTDIGGKLQTPLRMGVGETIILVKHSIYTAESTE